MRKSEHDEQAAFVAMVHLQYRQRLDFVPILFFSVPNGAWLGGKSYAMLNKLRAEGLQNGVSDLIYLQPRGPYTCLTIEMKAPDKKRAQDWGLTTEQTAFIQALQWAGGRAEICFSADEAMEVFRDYMSQPTSPPPAISTNVP